MGTTERTSIHDSAAGDVVDVINPRGQGDFVLVCEHASNAIPADLHNLGLSAATLETHVAWDPGALAVAREMARALDAPLVASRFSRLLYDCNRGWGAPDAIAVRSEWTDIPGNKDLGEDQRRARFEHYYVPFRDAVSGCLDARASRPRPPVLLTIHSFTPVFTGLRREVEIGILHDQDPRFAHALLAAVASESALAVRLNEPYGPQDGVDHTLHLHGVRRGLLNAMIEIRHDLIASTDTQRALAAMLSRCAVRARTADLPPATEALN